MERPVRSYDLLHFIQVEGIVSEEIRCHMFRQMVEACIFCEKRGFVHGDLKPENILVDVDTFNVKLIDFGLSRYFVDDDLVPQRCDGTLAYFPPEWFNDDGFVHLKPANVWSLGVILFEISTLRFTEADQPPDVSFVDANLRSLLASMLNVDRRLRISLKKVSQNPWTLRHTTDETLKTTLKIDNRSKTADENEEVSSCTLQSDASPHPRGQPTDRKGEHPYRSKHRNRLLKASGGDQEPDQTVLNSAVGGKRNSTRGLVHVKSEPGARLRRCYNVVQRRQTLPDSYGSTASVL